ncbi:hypothetical protein [Aestuariivita sp.]|jgi:hypothetical protein|uniref:hypothetical protein n=1 Tax=Aestuariivita sp. TaxID=1872407 RepID=UPI0025BD3BA4|nr:hypothetical protein [Aestuariivita sp.]
MADGPGPVKSIVSRSRLGQNATMRVVVSLCILLILSGCAPLSIYHRAGVPVAKMEDDRLTCEVEALRDAPVANQVRQGPAQYIPPRQYCDANGNCVTRGGYWEPGAIYTVDVNRGLRARLLDRCMAQQGYRPVTIPLCPQSIASAAPPAATTTLPPLTANSCAIRNRGGTWQIVNRG